MQGPQRSIRKRFLVTCLSILLGMSGLPVLGQSAASDTDVPLALLYSNNPLATGSTTKSGVAAPAGTQWSEVQNDTGNTAEANTTSGVGCQIIPTTTTNNRCADDFTVPAGRAWLIDSVVVYAYQTGAGTAASPITAVNFQIWNGRPGDAGSTVIFGDTTTNRLTSSVFTNIYRIFNTVAPPPGTAPGTTRAIWANTATVSPALRLQPGTYWIDFQVNAGTTGNFTPAATVVGARTQAGWNAIQNTGAGWAAIVDTGNPMTAPDVALDLPFQINGTLVPTAAGVDVSGRVISRGDRSVRRASVSLTAPGGVAVTTTVDRNGEFIFHDVQPGQTYILQARSGRFAYNPLVLEITDSVTGIELTPTN